MVEDFKRLGLLIEYRQLGTVSIDEFRDAIIEDINALKEHYNVQYITGARLRLPVTNEYGDRMEVRYQQGRKVYRIDTHHFRPSCMDYDL